MPVAVLTSSWWARASSAPPCAYYLAAAGVRVRLLDRSYVASGSSGACEGNVLAWDKELERELPLALRSADLWAEPRRASSPDDFEYDRKGSVVVAETEAELAAVAPSATRVLAGLGVEGEVLDADALRREEPLRRARPPGRRAVPRRRAARAAPGDRRAGPRPPSRAGAELCHRRQRHAIVRGADGRATGVETSAGLRRRGHGRRRRRRVDAEAARRPRA